MGRSPRELEAERRRIEALIEREEEALGDIVRLVRSQVPLPDWPRTLRDALAAALREVDDPIEATKARWLAWHLFRSFDPPALLRASSALEDQRLAERIRADLAGLVPLGAGNRCRDEGDHSS